jgi:hypothetical protein
MNRSPRPTWPSSAAPRPSSTWPGKTDYGGNYGSTLTGLTPGFQHGFGWEAGTLPPIHIQMPGNYRRAAVLVGEILDGTSQTLVVLEDADRPAEEGGLWASGHNCFAHDQGPVNSTISNEIFSRHPGGAFGLLADGAVRLLSESMDLRSSALCVLGREERSSPNSSDARRAGDGLVTTTMF